ncbi:hypothetical protein Smp_130380 [Schistosoma mansoni]|uniref:hypothetical protein n=1 Tax=Schistosoma mansoni TaxID=6183 RepID=UPI0001A6414C|nr:hypothetical protein Smp_130380 [Schistosoma mansoni]|eukprot:XP_018651586.1 hypothetical protein Smp_130380 [Schistosoma mansoni]
MKWIYYIYSLLMNYLLPIHSIIYHEGIMEENVDMTVDNEEVQSYVDDSNMNPNADESNLSTSFIVPIMTDEQRLLSKILNGYDTASRPIFNASKSVQVGFQFTLIQISQLVSLS